MTEMDSDTAATAATPTTDGSTPAPAPTPAHGLAAFPAHSTARVATDRPARYGKQLASHMGRKLTASWDEGTSTGRLEFNREGPTSGVLTLRCEPGALVMELAAGTDDLARLEHVAGIHLARFGRKDALAVTWIRPDGSPGTTQGPVTED